MFEQPADTGGVGFGIAGSSDGIEREANAEHTADGPVRDAVTEEVKEDPGGDHGQDGSGFRLGGSRQSESGTGGCDSGKLESVSGGDGEAGEDPPSCGRG